MIRSLHWEKCLVLLIENNFSSVLVFLRSILIGFRIIRWSDKHFDPMKCNFRLHVNKLWTVICLSVKILSDKPTTWSVIRLERIKREYFVRSSLISDQLKSVGQSQNNWSSDQRLFLSSHVPTCSYHSSYSLYQARWNE